jgi:hypothetical protein
VNAIRGLLKKLKFVDTLWLKKTFSTAAFGYYDSVYGICPQVLKFSKIL